jgi:D-tyrosyl-tRNA(Tyr) deacylase
MKLVVQRVSEASVSVDGRVSGKVGRGLLVLLCIEKGDNPELAGFYAKKVAELRIFPDQSGKMNLSLLETNGEVLLISQFTLAGDVEKGRRPSFDRAAPPAEAEPLYNFFASRLEQLGVGVATGVFAAYMQVSSTNDGPVTILMGRTAGQASANADKTS